MTGGTIAPTLGDIINIVPVFAARRIAIELMRRQGFDYFTVDEDAGPRYRLDADKLDLVAELARRDALAVAPVVPPTASDMRTCRRLLRREMIRRVTSDLASL